MYRRQENSLHVVDLAEIERWISACVQPYMWEYMHMGYTNVRVKWMEGEFMYKVDRAKKEEKIYTLKNRVSRDRRALSLKFITRAPRKRQPAAKKNLYSRKRWNWISDRITSTEDASCENVRSGKSSENFLSNLWHEPISGGGCVAISILIYGCEMSGHRAKSTREELMQLRWNVRVRTPTSLRSSP